MEDVYNYLKISDCIATSGQPTKEQFSTIKELGYQVVINLALPTSTNALPNEAQIVADLGMQYNHIPLVWENPKLEDVERFFSVMKANSGKKIFVHCAANMRVSAFMYLYHRLREEMSDEEAKKQLHRIWLPDEAWQRFIEQVVEYYS